MDSFISKLARERIVVELNREDANGQTALLLAAAHGHTKVLNYLLKQSVNVNHQNRDNDSILHLLVKNKRNNALEFLLKWNASENKLDVDLKNSQGFTALHLASQSSNEEAIYYLCSYDAYINMVDNEKRTPLQLAILSRSPSESKVNAILALMRCGADYTRALEFCAENNIVDDASRGAISNYMLQNGQFKPNEQLSKVKLEKICNLVFQGGSVKGKFFIINQRQERIYRKKRSYLEFKAYDQTNICLNFNKSFDLQL